MESLVLPEATETIETYAGIKEDIKTIQKFEIRKRDIFGALICLFIVRRPYRSGGIVWASCRYDS